MRVLAWLLLGFPREVRRSAVALLVSLALMCASAVVTFMAAQRDPELLRALAPQALRESIESLAASGQAPASAPAALAAGFYVRHNVAVALAAVALGFTFGAGTLALLVQNGAVAGVSVAIAAQAGAGRSFLGFVAPHAPWELAAIATAGAAGLQIGWALAAPGLRGRGAAMRAAVPHATRLLAGAAVLLAVAGALEATISPRALPLSLKLAVSGAGALLVALWLAVGGRHG